MTKSQKYLIFAILALFAVVIFVFRGDMFHVENRPGVSSFLQNTVQPYGLGLFILLFAYFLAKSFNTKWWVFISLFIIWELSYIIILNFGAGFLPQSAKMSSWLAHYKKVGLDNRSMIQFQDETAQFDTELFYTLKPGESRFKSFEFDTEYKVNSLGVRDTEESLAFPELLFLGDSYTMGWGVEQSEAFSHVVAEVMGKKGLSSGVSSYGTAREYRMMARVQTDSLKAIIIQYHDTDLEENDFYIKNQRLVDRTQIDFDNQVLDNKKYRLYFPFKYIKTALLQKVASLQDKAKEGENASEGALKGEYLKFPNYLQDFYVILDKIKEIKDVPVIVTYTGSFYTDPMVIQNFEAYATQHNISNVYFVNLAGVLSTQDYFFFDDHLNKEGHLKVADKLVSKLKQVL